MRRLSLWVGGAIVCYFLAALIGAVVPGPKTHLPDSAADIEIALISGPIHYDILLPLDTATRTRMGWLRHQGIQMDTVGAQWLVIGWGARGFYTTTGGYTDLQASTIWRGLTGDSAVMRVSLAGALPQDIQTRKLTLTPTQYDALLDNIEASLPYGKNTPALDLEGFSDFDRFFPAKGRFHLFNTCNVWIGRTLRQSGVRFGIWTPMPFSVTLSHWLYTSRGVATR